MPHPKILLVDDDQSLLESLTGLLTANGYQITAAASAEEAIERCRADTFHLVLCDLQLPGRNGISLTATLREACPATPVVLITGHGSIRSAVTALKRGAVEYVTKPVKPRRLLQLVAQLTADPPQFLPNAFLARAQAETVSCDGMVARSPVMRQVFERIEAAATCEGAVLILGEAGTGKELVARAIHAQSPRARGPFVALQAGAVRSGDQVAELLGSERGLGRITERRPGRLEQAEGGTLFIDEVGALDERTQLALARVLETGRAGRIGGRRDRACDLRVIAASSRDLEGLVRAGTLREELYYRLAALTIHVPPLRERAEDVAVLVDHFIRELSARYHKPAAGASPEAQRLLAAYGWPGNVRELRSAVEQAVLLARGPLIEPDLLPASLQRGPARPAAIRVTIGAPIDDVERELILRTLEAHQGNKTAAAQALGISRRSIYNKLAAYGV
jgi:DNA-binding NtrC family response regulator